MTTDDSKGEEAITSDEWLYDLLEDIERRVWITTVLMILNLILTIGVLIILFRS